MTKKNLMEKDVRRQVRDLLSRHGWFWWSAVASPYSQSGISDFCCLKTNVFMAVETKVSKNMPTPLQKAFLESIKAEGGMAFVVNDLNVGYLRKFLEAYDRSVAEAMAGKQPSENDGSLMLNCIKVMEELWIGGTYETLSKLVASEASDERGGGEADDHAVVRAN
jgi:hypothetical protein